MEQVHECGSTAYRVVGLDSDNVLRIIVASKDTDAVAAALVGAWEHDLPAGSSEVRAYFDAAYSRWDENHARLTERAELDGLLVFDICIEWVGLRGMEGVSETCNRMDQFVVSQAAPAESGSTPR